jgi:hypothetical protein
MQNWETLIADKIAMHRDSYHPQRIEDPGKRNQANAYKRWAEKNPERRREIQRKHDAKRRNDPKRKAWQKEYDASPERKQYHQKYREENKDEINARHREYNATEKGKAANSKYNAQWREKNKEYDRERKRIWWRKTHPNPGPIGRPKKEKT